jgi:DNA-binding CsgD family transcriptional regulator
MKLKLEELVRSLDAAHTLEEVQAATERLRDILGIKHTVYHWVNAEGEQYGAGTYSTEWIDRYLEKGYLRLDPVLFGCFQRFTPVEWKELDWSSRAARGFLQDALDHGVGNQGYSIPMRGPQGQFTLFTFNHDCDDETWEAWVQRHARDLMIVSHEFNKCVLGFEQGEGVPVPSLSPREVAAMTALAQGKSRAQAAADISISEHTLRVYIESARHKLGAMNTTHAVARALSLGIIIV